MKSEKQVRQQWKEVGLSHLTGNFFTSFEKNMIFNTEYETTGLVKMRIGSVHALILLLLSFCLFVFMHACICINWLFRELRLTTDQWRQGEPN